MFKLQHTEIFQILCRQFNGSYIKELSAVFALYPVICSNAIFARMAYVFVCFLVKYRMLMTRLLLWS